MDNCKIKTKYTMQDLTNAFIQLRLNEFVNGFLSNVSEVIPKLKQEIDRYLSDYDPLNYLEYE